MFSPASSAPLKLALVIPVAMIALSLGLAATAGAQTLRDYLPTPQPKGDDTQTPFSQVLPSDSGIPPNGTPTDHQRHGRTSNQAGLRTSHLCFQPGAGWIEMPIVPVTQDQTATVNFSGTDMAGESSTLVRHTTANRSLYSGAKPPVAAGCPPASTYAPGKGREDSASWKKGLFWNPTLSVGEHSASRRLTEPWATTTETLGTFDPTSTAAQIKDLRNREYISPIRLRRLSRNVPDLNSRLELRRIQEGLRKRPSTGTTGLDRSHTIGPATLRHRIFSENKSPCDRKNGRAPSHRPCSRSHK